MAATVSYSPHHLREGELCHGWNNELFENSTVRIIENGVEKSKQETNSPSLPYPCKSKWGWW
jgi:hypothetical protein